MVGFHGEDKELAMGGEFNQWKGRSRGIGQFFSFSFFYQALHSTPLKRNSSSNSMILC